MPNGNAQELGSWSGDWSGSWSGDSSGGWSDGLLESGFGDPQLAALLGWRARVARMVEVEAALARALARTGLMPGEAADAVVAACDIDRIDLPALARQAANSATPAIPLVKLLQESADESVKQWLHFGATSQDILDTASSLQIADALRRFEVQLLDLADRCRHLALEHAETVMAGRTLGQQAAPITLGLKAARWLGRIDRNLEELWWLWPRVVTVQLGGSVGTSALYGDASRAVTEALAAKLNLEVPDLAWHAERDRIGELAGWLSNVAGTVMAIAAELIRLAQTEVSEAIHATGDGPTSSALPHKRNPTHAIAARAAGYLAVAEAAGLQALSRDAEGERSAGAWQAEWVALPSAMVRTAGGLTRLGAAMDNLGIDGVRAGENLDRSLQLTASEALSAALMPQLGRSRAQELVAELCATAVSQQRRLGDVASEHELVRQILGPDAIAETVDPAAGLGHVPDLIDRIIATHEQRIDQSHRRI